MPTITTSSFRATTGSVDASGKLWSVTGGAGGETINQWLADDGSTPLQLLASAGGSAGLTERISCATWVERTSGLTNEQTIPADATIHAVRWVEPTLRTSGARFDANAIRIRIGSEVYGDLTTQTSDQTNLNLSLGDSTVLLGDGGFQHSTARMRDPSMTVEFPINLLTGTATAKLEPPTLEVDWSAPPAPKPDRAVAFNGSLAASGGASVSFSRDEATVDPQGHAVLADKPRFLRSQAIAPMLESEVVDLDASPLTSTAAVCNAIGADESGARRIGWMYLGGVGKIVEVDSETGDLLTLFTSTPTTKTGGQSHAEALAPAGSKYATDATWALDQTPYGRVAEGIISVYCLGRFDTTGSGNWETRGTVILESIDEGDTWEIKSDDTAEARDAGVSRGQAWAMTGPFAPFNRGIADYLEVWLAEADYIAQPASNSGRVWVHRYVRDSLSDPWTRSDALVFERNETGTHCHCAAVIEVTLASGRKVPGVIVQYGDTASSTTDLFVYDDGVSSYTEGQPFPASNEDIADTDNWTAIEGWHGVNASDDPAGRGTLGAQEIGAIPGPEVGEIIFAADNKSHWLNAWRVPDAFDLESPAPPEIRIIQFERANGDSAGKCFGIRCERPDGARAIAEWEMHPSGAFGGHATKVWQFSTDGFRTSVPIPAQRSEVESASIAFDWAIIAGAGGTNPGVKRWSLPSTTSRRAVVVGPGGTNLAASIAVSGIASSLSTGSPNNMRIIERHTDGHFYDFDSTPGDQDGNAAYRLPALPCLADYILRVDIDPTASSSYPGRIHIAPVGDSSEGAAVRRLRMWGLCRDSDRGGLISPQLNDGASGATLFRLASGHPTAFQFTVYSREDWQAFAGDLDYTLGAGRSPYIQPLAGTASNPFGQSWFFAYDNFMEGAGAVGWPMPPFDSSPVALPDERLVVDGVDWEDYEGLRVLLQTAPHAWDRFATGAGGGGEYVLATIEDDSDNYIEVVADTDNAQIILRLNADGGGPSDEAILTGLVNWPIGTAIDIGLYRDGDDVLYIVVVNGRVATGSFDATGLSASLDTLRIGAAAGESGAVSDIACFGATVAQGAYEEFLASMFQQPRFSFDGDRSRGRGRTAWTRGLLAD